MKALVIVVIALLASTVTAGNYDSAAVRQAATPSYSTNSRTASILRQIHLVNEDGSYTFGYENADGSFRMENRDIGGYVTGRYGYIDELGRTQEFDYVSGNLGGRSVGYQARSSLLPITSSDTSFPVVRTVSSNPLLNTLNTQNIVRTVETPTVVAATPAFTSSSVLRTVDPVTVLSSVTQPEVRLVNQQPAVSVLSNPNVRFVNDQSGVSLLSNPNVRFVNDQSGISLLSNPNVRFVNDQSAVSLVSNPSVRFVNDQSAVSLLSNPSVRFVNDQSAVSVVSNPSVRFVNEQPALSFVSNPATVLERFAIPQQSPAFIQNGQSIFGSSTLSRFIDQPVVVSRSEPIGSYGSTGQVLRNLVLGRNNNGYGQQNFRLFDNSNAY